jgi:hypothetical protein
MLVEMSRAVDQSFRRSKRDDRLVEGLTRSAKTGEMLRRRETTLTQPTLSKAKSFAPFRTPTEKERDLLESNKNKGTCGKMTSSGTCVGVIVPGDPEWLPP